MCMMSDAEYTITIHVRNPGKQFDPAFNITLQCRHCLNAWFKRVDIVAGRLPVECVRCGMIMDVDNLFDLLDHSQTRLGE